ncbi:MAG: SMI1/KNR4 family protein [Fibrobacteres bacterium]|nr:SMI1/KNR4 family protein [Fibrobacterota bacterium]
MNEQQIIRMFLELSEGRLTPEEWMIWVSEHDKHIEAICGRVNFLKIKPSKNSSDIRNAYHGQFAIYNWLKSKNIAVNFSDVYKKEYEKEINECSTSRNAIDKQGGAANKKPNHFNDVYPKLSKLLAKSSGGNLKIDEGKSIAQIQNKEEALSLKFSDELKLFFTHFSRFEFEGIKINFDHLEKGVFNENDFLILGEFWQYGDGDKLLCEITKQYIAIFAHEYNPPKIIWQAQSMTEFVEKILVQHINEYNEE